MNPLDLLIADLDQDAEDAITALKANYGARVGQTIAGRLVRGSGGRFSSGGATPAQAASARAGEGQPRNGGTAPARTRKPKQTPEQRAREKEQERARKRQAVFAKVGLAEDAIGALAALEAGDSPADDGGLIKLGLAQLDGEGKLRLTPQGRHLLSAANRGDAGAARDALSLGKDRAAAATERERQKQEKEKAGGGGGGGKEKKLTPEEKRTQNREKVGAQMAENDQGLSPAGLSAFLAFVDGSAADAQMLAGLADQIGVLDRDSEGNYRLNTQGRRLARALDKGDYRAALDAISMALDRVAEQQTEEESAAKAMQSDDGEPHPGAMIAFLLRDEDQQALQAACGELETSPDHLTLIYLTPNAEDLEGQKNRLVQMLAGIAETSAPLAGAVNGYGRFSGDADGDALYANFDSPALPSFRERLMQSCAGCGVIPLTNHGFTPHITLTYLDEDAQTPHLDLPDRAIVFDRFALAWAGETISFPLAAPTIDPFGMGLKSAAGAVAEDDRVIVSSIKAIGDMRLEIKVAYGGPFKGRDGQGRDGHGEFFDDRTDFDTEHFPTPPVAYYHGFDEHGRPMGKPVFIGKTIGRESRADGHYLIAELKKDNPYAERTWAAALKGEAVASPATVAHLRRRSPDGHLDYWPIAEISAWDGAPNRRPANPHSIAIPILKSLYAEAGISLPLSILDQPEVQPTGETQSGGAVQVPLSTSITSQEQPPMTPEELNALINQGIASALKTQQDAQAAEAAAAATRQAEIDTAVKTALAQQAQEFAKARRLPSFDGQAPAVTHFHDTRKYDSLDLNDMAFFCGVLDTAKRFKPSIGGVSNSALKALAIRIAEDKSQSGDEARSDLKAAGIAPEDVTSAAKANELNYSTQAGYGDEWVGVEYSRRLWEQIRAGTFVLEKLPSIEVPQGVESITIPLEGTDPVWYKVGQATGTNATTGRPDATVTTSKEGTNNKSLTVGKVGARVIYTGEMEEDSLIPWAAQLRKQLERSGSEQIESLAIDGDTETGATTNINDIGGTPASTDLFLTFNGFRKLALVTNTANSRSASGSLVDQDFLLTLQLMGVAGLNGADRTKVEFIIDANVMWKVMQLLSVKTRDVFSQATLENGMFAGIWGYKVNTSYFMHYLSSVRKANNAGKIDQDTTANNTTGAILSVRWDQWLLGYKRKIKMEMERLLDSDSHQIVAFARLGLTARDNEAAAISYNVGV